MHRRNTKRIKGNESLSVCSHSLMLIGGNSASLPQAVRVIPKKDRREDSLLGKSRRVHHPLAGEILKGKEGIKFNTILPLAGDRVGKTKGILGVIPPETVEAMGELDIAAVALANGPSTSSTCKDSLKPSKGGGKLPDIVRGTFRKSGFKIMMTSPLSKSRLSSRIIKGGRVCVGPQKGHSATRQTQPLSPIPNQPQLGP